MNKILSILGLINGPFFDSWSWDDVLFIDNKLVNDAIFDFELGVLEYIVTSSEDVLEKVHLKYEENLSLMNDEEALYFKNYTKNLILNLGKGSNQKVRTRKDDKYYE